MSYINAALLGFGRDHINSDTNDILLGYKGGRDFYYKKAERDAAVEKLKDQYLGPPDAKGKRHAENKKQQTRYAAKVPYSGDKNTIDSIAKKRVKRFWDREIGLKRFILARYGLSADAPMEMLMEKVGDSNQWKENIKIARRNRREERKYKKKEVNQNSRRDMKYSRRNRINTSRYDDDAMKTFDKKKEREERKQATIDENQSFLDFQRGLRNRNKAREHEYFKNLEAPPPRKRKNISSSSKPIIIDDDENTLPISVDGNPAPPPPITVEYTDSIPPPPEDYSDDDFEPITPNSERAKKIIQERAAQKAAAAAAQKQKKQRRKNDNDIIILPNSKRAKKIIQERAARAAAQKQKKNKKKNKKKK